MGIIDGAEICELVSLYLLNILKNEFGGKNMGLYRDNGLNCFENKSGPELEKIKKKICKIFKDNGLNITIETNLHITEHLDVTFNSRTGKYHPYRKQNNSLQYIHKKSNHLPSIIKRIPSMISNRLSGISSDKEHFDKAAPIFNEAQKNSGFNETLKFLPTIPTRLHRIRNIIWFNPPFNSNVKTNVGELFLNLLQKHFPRHYKYYKLFNKNNVKISYSCMSSMKNVIQKHNANLLSNHTTTIAACSCICRQKLECPLNKCLSGSLVYKATVSQTPSQINKYCYGTCEKTFK